MDYRHAPSGETRPTEIVEHRDTYLLVAFRGSRSAVGLHSSRRRGGTPGHYPEVWNGGLPADAVLNVGWEASSGGSTRMHDHHHADEGQTEVMTLSE